MKTVSKPFYWGLIMGILKKEKIWEVHHLLELYGCF